MVTILMIFVYLITVGIAITTGIKARFGLIADAELSQTIQFLQDMLPLVLVITTLEIGCNLIYIGLRQWAYSFTAVYFIFVFYVYLVLPRIRKKNKP